ncbi:flippase [Pectobacterium carotovorum]|uniref:flippase n=1 Tax=Pectobacterium carotovorum TaxID=554 RepID=UPI00208C29B2|nr:flippase [Pectobacterium carotovorum]GKW39309.1 transporter [Pectobacterium carotovorum subsp. carotovorum]
MNLIKKSIFLLCIVQLSNYLFPLLTFPYLSRVLGPDGFGQVSLAQSIVIYFTLFIDFGFNLSATRQISIACSEKKEGLIDEIYSSVTLAKLFLFLVSCFLCFLLTIFFEQFKDIKTLIYTGMLSLLGSVFFPIWLFQGVQKMLGIVVVTTFSKIISLALIFLIVKKEGDVNEAMISFSLGMLLSSLISIVYIRKNKMAKFSYPGMEKIYFYVKDSFPLFLSFFFSSVYTTMNTFILSFFSSMYNIGIYSAADKIKSVSQSAISPFQQAVFPKLSSHISDKLTYIRYLKIYGGVLFLIGVSISLFLAFLSKPIIHFLLGGKFDDSYSILLYMSPLPMIITLAIIFGQWGLVNIGKSSVLSKIYMFGGVVHLTYVFFMINQWGVYGAVFSTLITESFLTALMIYHFLKEIKKYEN